MTVDGEFKPTGELIRQSLHSDYDISSKKASELCNLLGIEDEIGEEITDDESISKKHGLTMEELDQAAREFANKKKRAELYEEESEEVFFSENQIQNPNTPSVKRVGMEIINRVAASAEKENRSRIIEEDNSASIDEDDYSRPTVYISEKIEQVKKNAERDIQEITRLEDLKEAARKARIYSFNWFTTLLELEAISSKENNSNSREISISFIKVEREEGTDRTLVLKHPSRYIPQSMEDLADIPLELHFADQPMVKVAVEVVSVKSYTLRAKLRTNADIENVNLDRVTEARIIARNPVFLIEELREAFIELGKESGYSGDFDMKGNLCDNIEFVFGPPGTGKTTHIAKNIILPLMQSDQEVRVLVLTPTNKAADVLVRRLMDSMDSDQSYLDWLIRFGATNDSIIEQSGVFRDKTFDFQSFSKSVTVTTIARFPYDYFLPDANTRLYLKALNWDYIIIDEASMIPLVSIIYPLYKKTPEKFIIAGDPFQIEPITAVDLWKDENIYTMVELKSFTEPKTVPNDYPVELLTTQYRSIPEIANVFSQFAYGGVLKHYRPSKSQRKLPIDGLINLSPVNIIKFPVSTYESIYRPKRLQNKTPYQVYSALFAFEFVKYLVSLIEKEVEDETFRIGLIAPYRAQANLIDKLMASVTLPRSVDVQVGTIHGFQGDECDIIIALFNPPPIISTHKDMFLNKVNIVNVSISRARDYLIVLMPDDETEHIENLFLIKKVEELCKKQSRWNEYSSSDLEREILGSETYLEDNSFSTSHQLVNVYGRPEKRYEVRTEDNAVDIQLHG
ncbi:MAG: DEAD/DEAH box helicase [Sphaerochaeta sp.]